MGMMMKYLSFVARKLLVVSIFFTLAGAARAEIIDFEGVLYNDGVNFSSIHTGSDSADSSDWAGVFDFDDNQEFLFSMDNDALVVSASSQTFSLNGGDASFELLSMTLNLNEDYSFNGGTLAYNITGDQLGTDNYNAFEFNVLDSGVFNTTSFDEVTGEFNAAIWGGDDTATYTGSEEVCVAKFIVCFKYETRETTEYGLGTDIGFMGTAITKSVPEPSILLLLSAGLMLVAVRRVRK